MSGVERKPLTVEQLRGMVGRWNARPALQIGRCRECAYWDPLHTGECTVTTRPGVPYHRYTDPDFFCGDFKPKEVPRDANDV